MHGTLSCVASEDGGKQTSLYVVMHIPSFLEISGALSRWGFSSGVLTSAQCCRLKVTGLFSLPRNLTTSTGRIYLRRYGLEARGSNSLSRSCLGQARTSDLDGSVEREGTRSRPLASNSPIPDMMRRDVSEAGAGRWQITYRLVSPGGYGIVFM